MAGVAGDFVIRERELLWNCGLFLGREWCFNRMGVGIGSISVTPAGLCVVVKSQLDGLTFLGSLQMTLGTVEFVEVDIRFCCHVGIYKKQILRIVIICQRNTADGEEEQGYKCCFLHCPPEPIFLFN